MIAPLDWGLGHATRCIPIIKSLQAKGCTVFVAAECAVAQLLSAEFEDIIILPLQGYRIKYAKSKLGLVLGMMAQVPNILSSIKQEHAWLNNTIKAHNIQLVISDNRYGCYSKAVPSVFITHQLRIKMPWNWLENLIQRINYRYINRFSTCWVPDIAGEVNLAGALAHPKKMPAIPVQYLGLLSRFEKTLPAENLYDYCFLISGPEPQRSIFEQKVTAQIPTLKGKKILVRGKPGASDEMEPIKDTIIYNHCSGEALLNLLQQSKFVICRSGYTTVMELMALHKKAILVPTPGQTEQEYVAKRLMQQQWALSFEQDGFNLQEAAIRADSFTYRLPELNQSNMETIVTTLLQQIS